MVKRRKELWVRAANALAAILAVCALLPLGVSGHHVGAAVRGVLPVLPRGLVRRRRHPTHCGRAPTVVAGRRIPPTARDRFGRDAVRLRRPQGPLHRLHPVRHRRRCRGTVGQEVSGHRGSGCPAARLVPFVVCRRPGGVSAATPVDRTSTASSRRCRRRSAPTPRRSRRRRRRVAEAAVAAVAAAAAAEEEARGDIGADLGRRAAGAGADRFRAWATTRFAPPTSGCRRRCPASTSS